MVHSITVDVCKASYRPSVRYRLYIDDELLTERDFVWDGAEIYIREHIQADLAPGPHRLHVQEIPDRNKITITNVTVDGLACDPDFVINQ